MEESSEAHMDAGVSSTTDDVQEVQEVASTHRNVETVITVESIKEEDMSPSRNTQAAEAKSLEKTEAAKPVSKLHPDLTFKKIIIKSPLKDLQVRPIQKSPTKPEEIQKAAGKDASPNKAVQPSTSLIPQTADSSSKVDTIKSHDIHLEKSVQSTTVNSSDSQKTVVKSPSKNSQESPVKETQQPESTKEVVPKNPKDKQPANKDPPLIVITKDKITKPPVKDQSVISVPKEGPSKVILVRESKTISTKDSSAKQNLAKDTPLKQPLGKETLSKQIPAKDSPSKQNPAKDAPSKQIPAKDSPSKENPTKDTPSKQIPAKDFLVKQPPANESQAKQTPGKESPAKQPPAKEFPAKQTPTKETSGKQIPVKEVLAKSMPPKEQLGKPSPPKEPPPKTLSIHTEKSAEIENKTQDNKETSLRNKNLSILEDKEASNDSQSMETNSDTSEKEHNKSISRELRSLINSAKESKIISECTQLTSKTRKSRTPLDTSLNTSLEADKIQGVRRGSDNSQISNSSEKSDKTAVKRSMRSQNPEFVSKVKNFLNSVSGKHQKAEGETDEESEDKVKDNEKDKESTPSLPKKKKTEEAIAEKPPMEKVTSDKGNKYRVDPYCWRCHWGIEPAANEKPLPKMHCTVCPRSFHVKCLSGVEKTKVHTDKTWVCPECIQILQAESSETRSLAMKKISLGMLCDLLKYALERMMEVNGVEPFINPVDRTEFPHYDNYVVHPMDLTLMRKQIDEGLYGSTEAFLADAQWILHNSIIFNTLQSKLTGGARALVRSCRAEMGEIEACPECYAAAHARRPTWFTDVCTTPHILLWAKLKGFPYWPAKGMSVSNAGLVDVRFFGAHDRAWVPARDCFLFSEKDPNNFRTKRQDILDSMQEAEQHIRNISRKYGKFVYAPFRTTFDPTKLNEQIKVMIPSFEGEVRSPVKYKPNNSSPGGMKETRRSNSKSSKGSFNDGDTSEGEENAVPSRKMASGAEIARESDDFSVDKDKAKTMEVDPPSSKENDTSRKRRRSNLEEAVITIIDSTREKRKRVASVEKNEKKSSKEPIDKKETTDKKETSDKKETTDKKETPDKKESTEKKDTSDAKEQDKSKSEVVAKNKDSESSTSTGNTKPSPKVTKDSEPSTSSGDTKPSPKVTPIRVISIAKVMKNCSPKVSLLKEEEKIVKQKMRADKANNKEKDNAEKDKEEKRAKRRNSNKNKSLNNSNVAKTVAEKKNDKPENPSKEKAKDNTANKNVESDTDKSTSSSDTAKSIKDRLQFDDDTSLAVLAREVKSNSSSTNLPTISSVRSLSAQTSTSSGKSVEIMVEVGEGSSIFTPTSTENVTTMKEAVNKLQKLRGENDPPTQVGRVGVRAFARMTSPPEKETRPNEVQVEIKAEPMDFEESEKQMQEKIDMMSAFKLRPVNPPTNLRDVRINKVVVTPMSRKGATAPQPVSMRAKKTFPQPKKPEEGRSELTSRNSMVYIPIQPPATQAPVRGRSTAASVSSTAPPHSKTVTTISSQAITNNANHAVNTITPPLVQFSSPSSSVTPTNSSNPIQTVATMGSVPTIGQLPTLPTMGPVPTVGQVPTTVTTMPLITSVNGQWTFSLQPVLSVGGVDNDPAPPMMNGIDRPALLATGGPMIAPVAATGGPMIAPVAAAGGPMIAPVAAASGPMLVPAAAPIITAQPANRTADTTPGELPRLQQRPSLVNPLDSNAPVGCVPPPSTVGPLTAKLNQNAVKMTDFFRSLLEDSIEKLDQPLTQVTSLKLQLESIQWRHKQEMDEIKHNHELTLAEMRSSFEKEKLRLVAETRRQSQMELDAAVKLAKTKQWCANCNQEAQFYCCWNTAYCDYPCQRAHWATHYAVCAQHRTQDNSDNITNPPENRLQQAPDNLPKTTAAPNLAAANKLQPSRMYTQEQAPQKTSIIVSMVEDNSGNQTMKCVGTYKSPSGPSSISPLIINKQIMSNEETAKKVVTSGGYLIVGASNATNSTTITPARRATAIQYIS